VVNGKAKGSKAELVVCKLITQWWKPVEPDVTFKRTPGSGGWGYGAGREKFGTAADIPLIDTLLTLKNAILSQSYTAIQNNALPCNPI
jgi:hypothetical protein